VLTTRSSRAFVALGGNLGDRRARLTAALDALATTPGVRVAAVSTVFENPAVGGPAQGDFWNAVAEVRTSMTARDLLARLHAIEDEAGRTRGVPDGPRTLDLDLLAHGDTVCTASSAGAAASSPVSATLSLPHPRALERAFVLGPWAEIAPDAVVPGTGATVLTHAARLRARAPAAFVSLRRAALLTPTTPGAAGMRPAVLSDRRALDAWRDGVSGTVGFLPTLGALHEGHATHVRRARAECDAVLASVFVNPTQFGPGEDFTRYPRTFEADLDLLTRDGCDAVYAPSADDLYPPGFSTTVDVTGPSAGYEGAARPGHFRGVATVVAKLVARARPDRTYFGRKDAQQVAVVRRLASDLDLPGEIVVGPTLRDLDGLALSSRNRYLSAADRARALAIPRALDAARGAAADGERSAAALVARARAVLDSVAGVEIAYVEVVDSDRFAPVAALSAPSDSGESPALMIVACKVGSTRLLDNEWMVIGRDVGARGPRDGGRT
jgi:pantoate--beta-alanine ligase